MTNVLAILFAFAVSTSSTSVVAQQASERTGNERADEWIVGALAASKLIKAGDVTVLDTRSALAFAHEHVVGSQRVDWRSFAPTEEPKRGDLLPRAQLERRIQALGIVRSRRVIVVGDPEGWGEDGRIVWMLRVVGHPNVALVDGGFPALNAVGVTTSRGSESVDPSTFKIAWNSSLSATTKRVAKRSGAVVVDVRTRAEYDGATPYGESRGGHVPGAKWLHFKDLMAADGTVKSKSDVAKLLAARGIENDSDVVLYCSGGVRSASALVVLRHYGYDNVRNYAGSMWEWSDGSPADHPLVTNSR